MLLHPKGFTTDTVVEALRYAQLDWVSHKYVRKLRDQLDPPSEFRPFDRSHWESYSFLVKEGLISIFHPDVSGKEAFKMLQTPRVKEFVESMTLVQMPHKVIATGLSQRIGYECSAQDVATYCQFFWDLTLVDSTEVRALLDLRFRARPVESSDNEADTLDKEMEGQALARAQWSDPRKVAASLPYSPFSAMSAQLKLGIVPRDLNIPKVLEIASCMIALKVAETATSEGPRAYEALQSYTTALKNVREILDSVQPADENLHKQLQRVALRTDDHALPTIDELTHGEVTAQMLPDRLLTGDGNEPSAEELEDGGLNE